MAKTVLISGANRGIGLEFVRQFVSLDHPPQVIIATCRDPEKASVSIPNKLQLLQLNEIRLDVMSNYVKILCFLSNRN